MTAVASIEPARAWRLHELDKLRAEVARTASEMKRLDGEIERLRSALAEIAAAPAIAVLDSLQARRDEAAARIESLMRQAADAFATLSAEAASLTTAAPGAVPGTGTAG